MRRTTRGLAITSCLAGALGMALMPAATAAPETTGDGQVFMVNPVQSSGDQNLVDGKDSATAVPASEYVTVPLRNLDGSGTLTGRWVNVRAVPPDTIAR